MSIFGKILDVASSFIPGGGLVKAGIKLAVPAVASIFKKAAPAAAAGAAGYGVAKITSGGVTSLAPIQGGLPALPGMGSGMAAAAGAAALTAAGPGGLPLPWWKGPGGKLQFPWKDPRIPEYLKQFALDDAYLKIYYRAPRGYVIIRDAQGRPFAVNRTIARQFGIWSPAAKPPISATDWKHYKRNKAIEKKIRKNFRTAFPKKPSMAFSGKRK